MTESIAPPTTKTETRTTRDLAKVAVSGWLGTAMEFMDFQLYSLAAAIVFNKIFFPDVSPVIGLIAAMATYGVGYVARLVGAVYFGRMGDRIGRKKVLFITIALMGASTTLIGVLPTYAMVGIWAPILLVALRLIQGFGAGAEIAGATVMLAEYAPARRRGLISSLVCLGTNSGTLAASALWAILVAVLSEDQLLTWGWRLPFLASFLLMIFAVWIRRSLKESPVFEQREDVVDGVALAKRDLAAEAGTAANEADRAKHTTQSTSTIEAALHQRKGKSFLIALGLRFGQAGNSGLIQTFLIGYLATVLLMNKSVGTTAIMYRLDHRLRHHPADRHPGRPLRPPAPVHRPERPHRSVRDSHDADGHQRQPDPRHHRHRRRPEPRRAEPVLDGKRHHGRILRSPHPLHPAGPGQGNRRHPRHRHRPAARRHAHRRHRALVAAGRHAHRLLADHPGLRRCRPRGPRPRHGPPGRRSMKAVVVHGANDLRIDERPEPVAGPGEVVLDVEWGGICGSDLSYWRHGASGTAALKSPLVLGHEVAGRIAQLGDGVENLDVGQPVTVHPAELVGDGIMPERLSGRTNLYPQIRYFGSAAFDPHTDGGFSERKLVRGIADPSASRRRGHPPRGAC